MADSLLCLSPTEITKAGCLDPIADIIKTANWNLGEFEFPVIDWGASRYSIAGSADGATFTGTERV